MFKGSVLCIRRSAAIRHASDYLESLGFRVTQACAPDVTHLLLPVPSFPNGDTYLAHILTELPDDVIICGGGLTSALLENYLCIDFLRDPVYLAENGAITADCALQILKDRLGTLESKRILVLGWGRIGKCLGKKLEQAGAQTAIGARKIADLAMIHALGYRAVAINQAAEELKRYDAIVNTIPAMVLPEMQPKEDAVILELASRPGMSGPNIINGRGLPGRMAPERSGKLIAETFIRLSL